MISEAEANVHKVRRLGGGAFASLKDEPSGSAVGCVDSARGSELGEALVSDPR